jgi:hypothetical protein
MSFVAVAIGGAAVLGAGASIYSANQQSKAGQNAANMGLAQSAQTGSNLQDYLVGGQAAQGSLQSLLGLKTGGYWSRPGPTPASDFWVPAQGSDPLNSPLLKPFSLADFQQSPDYQFNLQQGQQAIDKAAAARGNFYAPQTLQDTARFSQGLASQQFNNAYSQYNQNQANQFNRLAQFAGAGQNAAVQQGGFASGATQNAGNFLTSGAAANASGIQGAGMSLSQLAYLPAILAQQQAPSYFTGNQYGYSPTTGLSTEF